MKRKGQGHLQSAAARIGGTINAIDADDRGPGLQREELSQRRSSRELLTVDEALARVSAGIHAVIESEEVALSSAVGRLSAQSCTSEISLPPFDRSAVDGFGIAAEDIDRVPPFVLGIVRQIRAGETGSGLPLHKGKAIRIATGAPVPPGHCAGAYQGR